MTPNQQCKQAGLTLAELVSLTGVAVSTLKDWHKSNQVKFKLAIDAALYRREREVMKGMKGIQRSTHPELARMAKLLRKQNLALHDEKKAFTQLNKELVEALGNVLWDICQEDEPNVSLVYLAAASGVLRKAKELAE